MINPFEELWESAGDGFSSPVGTVRSDDDVSALMKAWLLERQDSIESRHYIKQMSRLLRKFVDVDEVPSQLRKRAKSLLRAVSEAKWEGDAGD